MEPRMLDAPPSSREIVSGSLPTTHLFPTVALNRSRSIDSNFTCGRRQEEGEDYEPFSLEQVIFEENESHINEELPVYEPRRFRRPEYRKCSKSTRSNKLTLEMDALGEDEVYLQADEVDGKVQIDGKVILNLPAPEQITYIRVRLRVVISTLVLRISIHGSGRHPVHEETVLWDDTSNIYPREGETSTEDKLQGTTTFPFHLHIPDKINIKGTTPDSTRSILMPPSFTLVSEAGTAEWATCRYFIKATVGRKGLLKTNERLIIPVRFLSKPVFPAGSDGRIAAIAAGQVPPGPFEDTLGWKSRKARQMVRRGLLKGKKAWYEAELYVPKPAQFAQFSSIPFAIHIISSDTSITGIFPSSSVTISLIQRVFVSAQGLTGTHDVVLTKVEAEMDGSPEDLSSRVWEEEGPGPVWGIYMKGAIKLEKNWVSTFKAPNLSVYYLLHLHIAVPGGGNDLGLPMGIQIAPFVLETDMFGSLNQMMISPMEIDSPPYSPSDPLRRID